MAELRGWKADYSDAKLTPIELLSSRIGIYSIFSLMPTENVSAPRGAETFLCCDVAALRNYSAATKFYSKNKYRMPRYHYLSQEGYDKLKAELDDLKGRGRQEAARAIAEAREKGDLSENAEYDAAKDAQGMLEAKINEKEKIMANARILDESTLDTSKAVVFTNVTIRNTKSGKEVTYKLVSESEADVRAKMISVNSPLGMGILGKSVGDVALVKTPRGDMEFEIVEITAG